MNFVTAIFTALSSMGQVASLLSELISEVKNLRLSVEKNNLEELKAVTNEKIEQLKNAKTDADRMRIIVELSKLQK